MVLQAKVRVTAETYYQLPEYAEHDFIQLIDGEVVIGVAARTRHQIVTANIHPLFWSYAKQHGGRALFAPTEVYLDDENIYEPDNFYLAPDTQCTMDEKRIVGAPELVVEILSPSSLKHDRETKFRAYEKHGVQEYWIVDVLSEAENIQVWVRREGRFDLLGVFIPDETFDSTVLKGLTVTVGDLLAG